MWDTRRFRVGGRDMTLNDIEQKTLRPLGDPRVHAALTCASLGCPSLPPKVFVAAGLDAQARRRGARLGGHADPRRRHAHGEPIFDWYGDDFLPKYGVAAFDVPGIDGKAEAAANFVAAYAPSRAARCTRAANGRLRPLRLGPQRTVSAGATSCRPAQARGALRGGVRPGSSRSSAQISPS